MTGEKEIGEGNFPVNVSEDDEQLVIDIGLDAEKYNELKVCDLDERPICKVKAETIQTWLDDFRSTCKDFDRILEGKAEKIGLNREELEPSLQHTESEASIVGKLLSDDYYPPIGAGEILSHVMQLQQIYSDAGENGMPLPLMLKLDVAAFKLLPLLGHIFADLPDVYRTESVSMGKREQRNITVIRILGAYKELGAEWSDNESKKPINMNGKMISISRLADKINIHTDGDVATQRYIVTCLKKLREEGDI